MAVDSIGNVYVYDVTGRRVQKFSADGDFILMFGGEVNKTTNADICTAASGDTCGRGTLSAAAGEFGNDENGSYISIGPGGTVYVGDAERVQEFDSSGNLLKAIPLPGELVQSLAVDSLGNIFVAFVKTFQTSKDNVLKLGPSGESLCTFGVKNPRALAVDAADNVYVASGSPVSPLSIHPEVEIRKFAASTCSEVPNYSFSIGRATSDKSFETTGIATNVVTNGGGVGLYYSDISSIFVRAFYPPPDKWPPPIVAPTVDSQFTVSADQQSAVVRATINPYFWADTTYYVEYGVQACSKGGCTAQPSPPGNLLIDEQVNEDVATQGIHLTGLTPGTLYHYRFVAQGSGSEGQPVRGLGGKVGSDGAEGTFRTFPSSTSLDLKCPNELLRTGAGANLPDCRGYEMVSPIDKNGGDIGVLDGFAVSGFNRRYLSRIDQTEPGGERITYSAGRAFPGAESAPWSSQYLADRGVGGWSTQIINPPLGDISLYTTRSQEIPFRAFSEDLCNSWVLQQTNLTLTSDAPTELPNLYRRRNCGASGYEVLTSVTPPGFLPRSSSHEYLPQIQGSTADGSHSIFRANGTLTPDAANSSVYQLYETSAGGDIRVVSVLPNGKAASVHSSLGTAAAEGQDFHNDSVTGAISQDGSRIFWTAAAASSSGSGLQLGEIYLRANPLAPNQAFKGPCAEIERACTVKISGPKSGFWAANPAGSAVLYQTEGENAGEAKLFEARIKEEGEALISESTEIAGSVDGVLGASKDLSRVYFISADVLAPGAVLGEPNLYLHEAGEPSAVNYIATLASKDVNFDRVYSVDSFYSSYRRSRVSADGDHAVFVSQAALTGYDNTDIASGESDFEVYLYDAPGVGNDGELHCISCNPSGARPAGKNLGNASVTLGDYWAAADIPGWANTQYAARVLSANGSRLFFDSYDDLLLSDTNGVKDVYEWQRAGSQKDCNGMNAGLYVETAAGCLSLISSGESPQESEFIDASTDGGNVFFTTNQSLVQDDPGLVDLYDARINGGFPAAQRPIECQGEACQGPSSAPVDPVPSSATFGGSGNVKVKKCAKGKRKVVRGGKTRCVRSHKQKKHKQKGSNAGQSGGSRK